MSAEQPQPGEHEPAPALPALDRAQLLELLEQGELELQGLMPWSSNYTFLARVCRDELVSYVIYKPRQGERPLWDFPSGTLCQREVAAYLVSEALGWSLVPPTVLRDGPYGPGMAQLFIQADYDQHYFTLRDQYAEQLQRIALFDVLINNADRKGGHCLLDDAGHIWAIDHGIAFHDEEKLRTVMWDWAGQPIPEPWLADIEQLQPQLRPAAVLAQALSALLLPRELKALSRRVEQLLSRRSFPLPGPGRSVPWPSI